MCNNTWWTGLTADSNMSGFILLKLSLSVFFQPSHICPPNPPGNWTPTSWLLLAGSHWRSIGWCISLVSCTKACVLITSLRTKARTWEKGVEAVGGDSFPGAKYLNRKWTHDQMDWSGRELTFQPDFRTCLTHSALFDLRGMAAGLWGGGETMLEFLCKLRGGRAGTPKICRAQACLEKWQLSSFC